MRSKKPPKPTKEERKKLRKIELFPLGVCINLRGISIGLRLDLLSGEDRESHENADIKEFALFQRPDGSDRIFVADREVAPRERKNELIKQQVLQLVGTHHLALVCAFAPDGSVRYEVGEWLELLAAPETLKFVRSAINEFLGGHMDVLARAASVN